MFATTDLYIITGYLHSLIATFYLPWFPETVKNYTDYVYISTLSVYEQQISYIMEKQKQYNNGRDYY